MREKGKVHGETRKEGWRERGEGLTERLERRGGERRGRYMERLERRGDTERERERERGGEVLVYGEDRKLLGSGMKRVCSFSPIIVQHLNGHELVCCVIFPARLYV